MRARTIGVLLSTVAVLAALPACSSSSGGGAVADSGAFATDSATPTVDSGTSVVDAGGGADTGAGGGPDAGADASGTTTCTSLLAMWPTDSLAESVFVSTAAYTAFTNLELCACVFNATSMSPGCAGSCSQGQNGNLVMDFCNGVPATTGCGACLTTKCGAQLSACMGN